MADDILNHYPELRGRPREMAMFCALFRERGMAAEALALGEAAVAAAPESLAIRSEVRTALSRGVASFHGPMLLDEARNAAYARAIAQSVRPGMLVLEIGAGSGLLAMLAARAGAQVVTCEANPMIAAAAQVIVARNGFSDRVKVVPRQSLTLEVPGDLDRPADMLIHEIFGSRLYDEGVTAALTDARRRLLKPAARSLPRAGSLRCALAGSNSPRPTATLADVHGFDLAPFELLTRAGGPIWRSRRQGLKLRSRPVAALRSDFDRAPPFGATSETILLESSGGPIEAIVQWIEIEFPDGARLENDPFADGPDSSWAAFPTYLPEPIVTAPGDLIEVNVRRRGPLVTMDVAKQTAA